MQVAALPKGKTEIEDYLYLDVDERGRATDCLVPTKPQLPLVPSHLPPELCRNLAILTMPVELDEAGRAVRYITALRVKLTVAAPGEGGK